MKKFLVLSLAAATLASAQQISKTAEPVKAPNTDNKLTLFLDGSGYWTCPTGSQMYVRRLADPPEKGKPAPPEDSNYYKVPDGNVIVNGHPSRFYLACIQEPK